MPFFVDIAERDLEYLRSNLTTQGFERLRDWFTGILQNCSDSFREERRLESPLGEGGSSAYFELIHIFPDGNRIYSVRFVVKDSAATYGVLQVIFVDLRYQDNS
jgi:hypothetical protein